jgi:hypothetical protein
MKKLLTTLAILLTLVGCTPPAFADTIAQEQRRCEKILWYEQKQLALEQLGITLHVLRAKDMKDKAVWGSMRITDDGPVIEIRATEDYQPAMSAKERRHQQDEVVIHELLHILLIQCGVPNPAQDTIIEAIRPGVRLP